MDEGVLVMIMVCKYSLFAYAIQDANNPNSLRDNLSDPKGRIKK